MQPSTEIDDGPLRKVSAGAMLELLKPITWFPPMWAFLCGVISAGSSPWEQPGLVLAGVVLTGPLVCGGSQIVNDWYDREVDAINEPNRPIPSGRVPGAIAFYYAVLWTLFGLLWGAAFGLWVFIATLVGIALAWGYSAPPLRFKMNGWVGNAAVGLSYEGLAWVTGAALILGGTLPPASTLWVAALYSIGAHGIMTLNDFKAIEGDRALGIRSLPAQLGPDRAARVACGVMLIPQLLVWGLLVNWASYWQAGVLSVLIILQIAAMLRLLSDPKALAPWYNGTGVTAYVVGMMVTATALAGVNT